MKTKRNKKQFLKNALSLTLILAMSVSANSTYAFAASCNHEHTTLWNAAEATCTEDGYTGDVTCDDCGELVRTGEKISATGHRGVATCVQKATCYECGLKYGDIDPNKHAHTFTTNIEKETCTKEGYTGDTYCDDCGTLVESGTAIPATGHTWSSGQITTEPTETEPGVKTFICTVCNETRTESVPVIVKECTHEETEIQNAREATCKKTGYTGDTVCKNCGKTLSTGINLPVTEHQWDEGVITQEPTEFDVGFRTYTCTICGDTKKEVVYKECEHTKTIVTNHVDATCTHKGYTGNTFCNNCRKVIAKGEEIPETDHTWDNGVLVKEATVSENGAMKYVCTVCGAEKTDSLPKKENTNQDPANQKTTIPATLTLHMPDITTATQNTTIQSNDITVDKVTALKVKNSKKKTATVSFKDSQDAKYQLQYSTDKKFKKSVKKKTLTKTSYKIKGLKKSKTYYVRVRAYKIVDGKEVYSNWVTKKVKIKK